MSKKKILAVDLNEIIRSLWIQFDRYYVEEFGEEGAPEDDEAYVYDFWEKYKWEDKEIKTKILKEDAPETINPKDYQVDEKGESNADFLLFQTETENLTAREVYNKFMYEDFCMDIFGFAPKMYPQVDTDSDKFYKEYKDQFDLAIVSKENYFSISPTLFFLAKVTPRFNSYFFYEKDEDIWDRVDILITTDPSLLASKPKDKIAIKLERPYNEDSTGDLSALNMVDFVTKVQEEGDETPPDNEKVEMFKKLINFKEEVKEDK